MDVYKASGIADIIDDMGIQENMYSTTIVYDLVLSRNEGSMPVCGHWIMKKLTWSAMVSHALYGEESTRGIKVMRRYT